MKVRGKDIDQAILSKLYSKALFTFGSALKTPVMTFQEYMTQAWPLIEPGTAFLPNWHIDCIGEHLEAVIQGQIRNLVINLPPRSGKSNQVSKLWPTWVWSVMPWMKFIFISYAQLLSEMFSKDRRDIIESDWYQRRWGSLVRIAEDQNQKREFMNTARGVMTATSIGGTLTGKGADIIVIDDGLDPERAQSKADREAAIRFIKTVVSTRLNDKRRGAIVEVSQRTHKQDISGILLAEGTYTHLNLQAIAEKKTIITFPISKKIHVREEGDVLHPEREDRAILEQQKNRMIIPGSNSLRSWQAQYQGNPSADEGALFRRSSWQFHTVLPQIMFWQWSWDTAMEEDEQNDYSVGMLIGYHGMGACVEKVIRMRMQYPELKECVKNQWALHPANILIIENKVSGISLAQDLKRGTDLPVVAYPRKIADGGERDVRGDKFFRASLVSPYVAAKRVSLRDGAIWVPEFVEECAEFPNGEYKDQVDAFSQGLNEHYASFQQPAMAMGGNGIAVTSPTNGHNSGGNGFQRSTADWM